MTTKNKINTDIIKINFFFILALFKKRINIETIINVLMKFALSPIKIEIIKNKNIKI